VGSLLSVVFVTTASCQGRNSSLPSAAKVFLDSSLVANEALYDSSTANVGMDRLACLEARTRDVLGRDTVRRIATEAERTVRARHTLAEEAAGNRGIEMLHDEPNVANCRRIDSLWYALLAQQRKARP